ncbi:acidic repeat-containing protein isoform X2 [Pteropus alecto]|uniref:acidic repeat-containing protein isoform X2 n=1 Tax=Pteropus alecto TaxID=9402 RepID=UPI000D537425|nr:acidic repeat-containing protein isoform X2 [Pteropus alecto]XP_024900206.1 acidic repeat-containing protein isoform X2 [Pteropus alecto]XP_024900207.1 acidic repeat-containing protein isoform X2 [Pteropus alecto]
MDTPKETPGQLKIQDDCCVVIDSDSDDDLVPPGKKPKLSETCSKDEILVLSDTDEPPVLEPTILEPPIVISDDDDSDVEGPVMILDDSCDKEQDASVGEEVKEVAVSKSSSADDAGEKQLGGKAPADPEATPEVSEEKTVSEGKTSTGEALEPMMGQPRKRKCKTKNTCATPGKPIKPSLLVPPNVPSPPSVPARPASPFPPGMSVSSGLPVLSPNPTPFQQLHSGPGEMAIAAKRVFLGLGEERPSSGICHSTHRGCFLPALFVLRMPHFSSGPSPVGTSATRGEEGCEPAAKGSVTEDSGASDNGNCDCNIPGCFLRDVEKSRRYSGRNFKRNKDELVQRIYALFNSSVFDNKMPEKVNVRWNKKMLRTAGLCTTGELSQPDRKPYAKIEISLKVCDSADRVRDTFIHEICHAASWMLHGLRDSHGDTWKYYARKCNTVHPELPMVTRCHNYKINYKIYYECGRCKSRIGRYTKSLDTTRYICAQCKGPLFMVPLTRKDGTPIKPHVRPFAKYVQQNYRLVKEELGGLKHKDVMIKLGSDFTAKKQQQLLLQQQQQQQQQQKQEQEKQEPEKQEPEKQEPEKQEPEKQEQQENQEQQEPEKQEQEKQKQQELEKQGQEKQGQEKQGQQQQNH